jgi:hypothetical protein
MSNDEHVERAGNNETPHISNPDLAFDPRYNNDIETSHSELHHVAADGVKSRSIYEYDGYDPQTLEQADPMTSLNQFNQMYFEQPQYAENFNHGGLNILPDHQYPHQIHSALRTKMLNLEKKKM